MDANKKSEESGRHLFFDFTWKYIPEFFSGGQLVLERKRHYLRIVKLRLRSFSGSLWLSLALTGSHWLLFCDCDFDSEPVLLVSEVLIHLSIISMSCM